MELKEISIYRFVAPKRRMMIRNFIHSEAQAIDEMKLKQTDTINKKYRNKERMKGMKEARSRQKWN